MSYMPNISCETSDDPEVDITYSVVNWRYNRVLGTWTLTDRHGNYVNTVWQSTEITSSEYYRTHALATRSTGRKVIYAKTKN